MKELLSQLKPTINEALYQKDPNSSTLGMSIVTQSINLIDAIGLEDFNFKKLSTELNTTESSIYRYFENKHKLLMYLSSWYWQWLGYRLAYTIANVSATDEKLRRIIHLLVFPVEGFESLNGSDMLALKRIIISESLKVYLTKEVDTENMEGFFQSYKSFCNRIVEVVKELNPSYNYPSSLVSTLIEGIHLQKYFKAHMPSLNDAKKYEDLELMFFNLVKKTVE